MAPRPSRRRRDADEPPDESREDDNVDLSAAEHAWWAQRDIDEPWSPHPRREPAPEEAQPDDGPEDRAKRAVESDVLARHFGADWRTNFGFERSDDATPRPLATPEPEPEPQPEFEFEPEPELPVDTSDPYAVLGIEPSASWQEIVNAHRRQARRHHPDRLVGHADAEIARAEERIRDINVAYQELRIRRGK